jgi:hypothetical protein
MGFGPWSPLLFLGGGLVGQVLYWLPYCAFLRRDPAYTGPELRAAHPDKAWAENIPLAVLAAGSLSFINIFTTTDHTKPLNAFMVPAFFFVWISMFLGIVEACTSVTAVIKTGKTSRMPARFILGPRVRRAGLLRLSLGLCAAVLFFARRS